MAHDVAPRTCVLVLHNKAVQIIGIYQATTSAAMCLEHGRRTIAAHVIYADQNGMGEQKKRKLNNNKTTIPRMLQQQQQDDEDDRLNPLHNPLPPPLSSVCPIGLVFFFPLLSSSMFISGRV